MKARTSIPNRIAIVLIAMAACAFSTAHSSERILAQFSDNQSTFGPSELWTPDGINSEMADDFEVVGNIDRVFAQGFIWGAVDFQGVYVRFYQYGADGKPGALQKEYFLPTGLVSIDGSIDIALSPPFPATGKHFLSVQPVSSYWYWWSSAVGTPRGQPFYFRNLAAGQTIWQHGDNLNLNPNADLTFSLYGTVAGPGMISSLSTDTLTRSGYLEIFGNNFGGGGQVLIDGLSASIAYWASTRIVAYVPELARLTTVPVQVINNSGEPSNPANLTVTPRQPIGRINWRFRMEGPYAQVRPVIASDGTVYAVDAFFHLYALAADGRLKWLVRGAGDKGVAVGADGTVYVASEEAIRAFSSDGSAKWTFVQNPRAFICLGVSVGPDGNIYSVGTEGLGVFSLTPGGALRWQSPEGYARRIVDYGELVFGPSGDHQQLYFYANNHLRGLDLNGNSVFMLPGTLVQPAVAPDGSVHLSLSACSPNGSLLWAFPTPYAYNTFTPPDVGSDGTHFFVQNLRQLFALDPNGSQRWHVTLTNYVAGPVVDPLNTQLVMGSADTLDHSGFILSTSARDGREVWRVVLPMEDPNVFNPATGMYGFNQSVDTRCRFTADGRTAYIVTATATGDNNTSKSFVYSINAALGSVVKLLNPRLAANKLELTLSGPKAGQVFVVERSTDCVRWQPVLTNIATTPSVRLALPVQGSAMPQFFRAVVR